MARAASRRGAARSCLLALGLLGAGCEEAAAPDDAAAASRPAAVARILPVEAVLAGAHVPTLDPAPMTDAEIRKAIGPGPRCAFRYAAGGRPVLALRQAGPGAVVKLNGNLLLLAPEATEEEGGGLRLAAGPVRLTLTPDPLGWPAATTPGAMGTAPQPAIMVFAVADQLRAGYLGALACAPVPPKAGTEG